MIILDDVGKKLQLAITTNKTSVDMPCYASWREINSNSHNLRMHATTSNGTSNVILVDSPANGYQRAIDTVFILNMDSDNKVLLIKITINEQEYVLKRITLAPNEALEYCDGSGWSVISSSGSRKATYTNGTNPSTSKLQTIVLGADVVNANVNANTLQDVDGLNFPVVESKTYYFKFVIPFSSAITSTGSRWCINGPSLISLNMQSKYTLGTTSESTNYVSGYDLPALASASALVSGNMAIMEGVLKVGLSGVVTARFASEVSGSAITAKAGAYVQFQEIL